MIMYKLSNQSTVASIALVLAGTSSMFLSNRFNNDNINMKPLTPYYRECQQTQELATYTLKHEMMPRVFDDELAEPLVEMPIVKSVGVHFNKVNIIPLEFACVEDSEGFIE